MQYPGIQDKTVIELIDGLISCDDASWLVFLNRIGPLIQGVCFKAGLGRDDLDDIVQSLALKLLENNSRALRAFKFNDADSFFRWVKVVVSRIVLDHLRAREIKAVRERESGMAHWQESTSQSPGSDWAQAKLILESVSEQLASEEKVLFWLEYSDMENAEAAVILGITVPAIQQRLTRLRKKLKLALEGMK